MDFVGSVVICSSLAHCDLARSVGQALGLHLQADQSGRYEEFPAYVANVLGFDVALLMVREAISGGSAQAQHEYQLLVQTYDDAADDGPEVDLSRHLQILLAAVGVETHLETSNGRGEEHLGKEP